MTTHTTEATSMGFRASCLPANDKVDEDSVQFLFASPEYWTSKTGKDLLQRVFSRVLLLVVDEVHVAPKW
jgi:superfamily II DNA helicase RecQ